MDSSEGGDFEFPEWEPMDEAELDAIEAMALSLSASKRSKNGSPTVDQESKPCRRLPGWSTPTDSRETPRWAFDADVDKTSPNNGPSNWVPSPCNVMNKLRYPLMKFGGRIFYSRTIDEVVRDTALLLEIIESGKLETGRVSLGFDIEWRPMFGRGEERKTAVMQICTSKSHCFVMHIFYSGIPPVLRSILEDDLTVKAGVFIHNDARRILKDYDVPVRGLEDLSSLANIKLGVCRNWSLASLVEQLAAMQLDKDRKIRTGNWETPCLSEKQLLYAATDAFASWIIHEYLSSLDDAINSEGAITSSGLESGYPPSAKSEVSANDCKSQ
ncbi:Werner Syndrome-like exonuclease [Acorus calamus]|uniref:3'-5' exonuclease n=1 Tax=Acorus calamus TaxID=4465 RepID=A0AAV9CLP5_ACOCL|nr:Werner Syndrome-like exonuclease [Acorus calamus]